MDISFSSADCSFELPEAEEHIAWLQQCTERIGIDLVSADFVFCSDSYLLAMNKEHLNHDYYTDILTFDNSSPLGASTEIYISIDRVKENAFNLKVVFDEELRRVMVHGILHMAGYEDDTNEAASLMRSKETDLIALYKLDVPRGTS